MQADSPGAPTTGSGLSMVGTTREDVGRLVLSSRPLGKRRAASRRSSVGRRRLCRAHNSAIASGHATRSTRRAQPWQTTRPPTSDLTPPSSPCDSAAVAGAGRNAVAPSPASRAWIWAIGAARDSTGRRRSSPSWDQHRRPARTSASIRALARRLQAPDARLWRIARLPGLDGKHLLSLCHGCSGRFRVSPKRKPSRACRVGDREDARGGCDSGERFPPGRGRLCRLAGWRRSCCRSSGCGARCAGRCLRRMIGVMTVPERRSTR